MNQTLSEVLSTLLQVLGASSVVGGLGLYSAWLAFPPELVIEAVVDKSKSFNSESKIKIKNNGRLPALNIKSDVENLCAKIGNGQMNNIGIYDSPDVASKLSYGEISEISIRPGIRFAEGTHISEFSYILILKHRVKFLFLSKQITKKWKVELHNFADGYSWDIKII